MLPIDIRTQCWADYVRINGQYIAPVKHHVKCSREK